MPAPSSPRSRQAVPRSAGARPNRRREVHRAAVDVFWRKGYNAASIQDVADRVGVLKGSLYHYIESKEDLLWWIVEDVHAQSSQILQESLAVDAEPIERVRTYIARHVEWYLSNVPEVSVFFHEWRHLSGRRLKITRERRRGYERIVLDLFTAARAAGDVSPELDLANAARYVLAAVNAVPDWYRPSTQTPRSAIAEDYAEMTVGLLTGTPDRRRRR